MAARCAVNAETLARALGARPDCQRLDGARCPVPPRDFAHAGPENPAEARCRDERFRDWMDRMGLRDNQ